MVKLDSNIKHEEKFELRYSDILDNDSFINIVCIFKTISTFFGNKDRKIYAHR